MVLKHNWLQKYSVVQERMQLKKLYVKETREKWRFPAFKSYCHPDTTNNYRRIAPKVYELYGILYRVDCRKSHVS